MTDWKQFRDFSYEVSSDGKVRQLSTEKEMKQTTFKTGYKMVTLSKDKKKFTFYVHRLVVECFIGKIPTNLEVNHINGVKDDNHLDNLEVVTRDANHKHAIMTGLKKYKVSAFGVKRIRELFKLGVTAEEIAKLYDINRHSAWKIISGKSYSYVK